MQPREGTEVVGFSLVDQAEKGFPQQTGLCGGPVAAARAPLPLISGVPRESFWLSNEVTWAAETPSIGDDSGGGGWHPGVPIVRKVQGRSRPR